MFNVSTIEGQMADAYKIIKSASVNNNIAHDNSSQKDKCSIFGEMVASRLRDFNELPQAIIMNEIDNLLFNAKLKYMSQYPQQTYNISNPNTHTTTLETYPNNSQLTDFSPSYYHNASGTNTSPANIITSPSPSPSSSVASRTCSETENWHTSPMEEPTSPNYTDAVLLSQPSQNITVLE